MPDNDINATIKELYETSTGRERLFYEIGVLYERYRYALYANKEIAALSLSVELLAKIGETHKDA